MASIIALATAGAFLAAKGAISAVHLLGFGATGVVGGSVAAWIQSMIGCVAAGSWFSVFQSIGAAGFSYATNIVLVAGGGLGGLLAGFLYPVGGSVADFIQSMIGSVEAGSWFSAFQTTGAKGFSYVTNIVLGAGSGLGGFLSDFFYPVGGSVAGWIQSMIGSVEAGSWFSVFQSTKPAESSYATMLEAFSGLGGFLTDFLHPVGGSAVYWIKSMIGSAEDESWFSVFQSTTAEAFSYATNIMLGAVSGFGGFLAGFLYPVGGSVAAWIQSLIGCVEAWSWFSVPQSTGAAGFSYATSIVLGAGGALGVFLAGLLYLIHSRPQVVFQWRFTTF